MEDEVKLSLILGQKEFEMVGSESEVKQKWEEMKQSDEWDAILQKIKLAKKDTEAATVVAKNELGADKFASLIHHSNITTKSDRILAAIFHLRDLQKLEDCPPRTIEKLFDSANLENPGNLSLYVNRLRDRGFLTIPEKFSEKNRYVILTEEGHRQLNQRFSQ